MNVSFPRNFFSIILALKWHGIFLRKYFKRDSSKLANLNKKHFVFFFNHFVSGKCQRTARSHIDTTVLKLGPTLILQIPSTSWKNGSTHHYNSLSCFDLHPVWPSLFCWDFCWIFRLEYKIRTCQTSRGYCGLPKNSCQ